MAGNKKGVRQSLVFSTPQANRKSSSFFSRRSVSQLNLEENDSEDNDTIFAALMNDPFKKALLTQFLSYNKNGGKEVLEMLKQKANRAMEPLKKQPFLSPVALRRKRAMAAMQATAGSSSVDKKKYPKAPLPFNKLLCGVVAYVEIYSGNQDRSAGVKALLKTMGAKVSDKICRGITHAIIKDVSYDTYSKANLVKAHLVSVLWLEAVRKNHCRVPEKDYPALGLSESYCSNISLLCEELQKDYADVVKDELERSRNLQRSINCNLSTRFSEDVIDTSQEYDVNSLISGISRIRDNMNAQGGLNDLRSENSHCEKGYDSESDMGLVNGQIMQKREDSNLMESSGEIEHNVVNSIADKLKDFSDSSRSLSSRNSSPVNKRNRSRTPLVNKRKSSVTKENVGADKDQLLKSIDDNFKGKRSLSRRKTMASIDKSKESQLLDVLSELHVSDDNVRCSQNKSHNSNSAEMKNAVGSLDLRVSTESNKEPVGVSEPVPSLRISNSSSKRRTTASSVLSSLRISTESTKSKKETVTAASEPVPSLRVSSGCSKRQTAESGALESLRMSSGSSQSKRHSKQGSIGSEQDFSKSEQDSSGSNQNSSESKNKHGKSKKRLDESKRDLSKSKNDSLGSNESKEVSDVESFKTPDKDMAGLEGQYSNVTQRKKKKPPPQILTFSDDSTDKSSPEMDAVKEKPSKPRKRRLYDPNHPEHYSAKQGVTHSEGSSDENYKSTDKNDKTERNNNKSPNEVDVAPVLMTTSAWKAVQKKLPKNLSSDDERSKRTTSKDAPSPSKRTKTLTDQSEFKTPGKPVRTKHKVAQSEKKQAPRRSLRRSSTSSELQDFGSSQKNRRSTLDFLPKESFKAPTKSKNTQSKARKLTSIVCSRFHSQEVQVFTQIVNKLGTYFVEDEVSEKTSHLVLAEPKRTVNVLRALARGCWILKTEWLYGSLEEGKWLPEEDYEMTEYSPAVQKSRLERQAFGHMYSMEIFKDCGNVYVAKSTNPRCSDLQELIRICKGKVTTTHRNAAVIVGEYVMGETPCVSVNWLLDSITFYKRQQFKNYLLKPPGGGSKQYSDESS